MMWPWTKGGNKKLERARRELEVVKQRTPKIEAQARRLEKHKRDNSFALRFDIAFGGKGEPR